MRAKYGGILIPITVVSVRMTLLFLASSLLPNLGGVMTARQDRSGPGTSIVVGLIKHYLFHKEGAFNA